MKFRLVESLLTEGKNIEKTWEQYKYKLILPIKHFGDIPHGVEDVEQVKNIWLSLMTYDPTIGNSSNGTLGDYGIWLTNLIVNGNIKDSHDIQRAQDLLKEFILKKKTVVHKDINHFKTMDALQAELDSTDFSDRQKERQKRRSFKDADLVYSDSDWEIWVPKTYEASCSLGAGSGWCTADTRTRDHYDNYLRSGGEYYILISKFEPIEKYQFHFETDQFFGAGTNEGHTPNKEYAIFYNDFVDQYPEIGKFFSSIGKEAKKPVSEWDIKDSIIAWYDYDSDKEVTSAIIKMDELQVAFGGAALDLPYRTDFASYYYGDIVRIGGVTNRKYFTSVFDHNKEFGNKMSEMVQEALTRTGIKLKADYVMDDEQLFLNAYDSFLSDSDVCESILKDIFRQNPQPYIEYDDWKYVKISWNTDDIVMNVYDWAMDNVSLRDETVDDIINKFIKETDYYYLDSDQALILDAQDQHYPPEITTYVRDVFETNMIAPYIIQHSLDNEKEKFFTELVLVMYEKYEDQEEFDPLKELVKGTEYENTVN